MRRTHAHTHTHTLTHTHTVDSTHTPEEREERELISFSNQTIPFVSFFTLMFVQRWTASIPFDTSFGPGALNEYVTCSFFSCWSLVPQYMFSHQDVLLGMKLHPMSSRAGLSFASGQGGHVASQPPHYPSRFVPLLTRCNFCSR